ncbi:MAG: esterase [Microscillaceae bacterium]
MQVHHLSVQKTARFATLNELTDQTRHIWFVCHGYGQLAPYFIQKFAVLPPESHFVVAPEALSRFYMDGFSGKVGATWMTREDREQEIGDYLAYLNQLYKHVISSLGTKRPDLQITLLGFSQGAATVSRWAFDGQVHFDRLILWGGNIAHDLDFSQSGRILAEKALFLIYGRQDPLIPTGVFEEQVEKISQLSAQTKVIAFEGGHEIPAEVLQQYFG